MSDSLGGGLVPLKNPSGSGSVSASNLSGGLIPLRSGARSSGALGRIGVDRSEISHSIEASKAWREDQVGEREPGNKSRDSHGDKMSKRRSSSKGSSRSRSKSSGAAGDGPSDAVSADQGRAAETAGAKEPEEDSYLFMGATAGTKGAKGTKSGGVAAEAAALLLDSSDSFGLSKPKTRGRERVSKPDSSGSQAAASETNVGRESGVFGARRQEDERKYLFVSGKGDLGSGRRGDSDTPSASSRKHEGTSVRNTTTSSRARMRRDQDVDFDSPNEMDALLQLTDPAALAGTTTKTKPRPGLVDSRSKALEAASESLGFEGSERIRRPLTPSPPSSPRKGRSETPDHGPQRFRARRGLVQQDALKDPAQGFTEGPQKTLRAGSESGPERESAIDMLGGLTKSNLEEGGASFRHKEDGGGSGERPGISIADALEGEKTELLADDARNRAFVGVVDEERSTLLATGTLASGDGNSGVATEVNGGGCRTPRRSALMGGGKPRPRAVSALGVTFGDDATGIDPLNILPGSSDEDNKTPVADALATASSEPVALPGSQLRDGVVPVIPSANKGTDDAARERGGGDGLSFPSSFSVSTSLRSGRKGEIQSTSITEGLSPAAARLVAEDSSSEERTQPLTPGTTPTVGSKELTDDAKLDLALGFTPSAMSGGRKPRRSLPQGSRRRAQVGVSPLAVQDQAAPAADGVKAMAPVAAGGGEAIKTPVILPHSPSGVGKGLVQNKSNDAEDVGVHGLKHYDGESPVSKAQGPEIADVFASTALAQDPWCKGDIYDSGGTAGLTKKQGDGGVIRGEGAGASAGAAGYALGVKAPVLASLERQLILLTAEKERAAAKVARDEERLQREVNVVREALKVAEARAFEAEAALAAARARIRQLEAEATDHAVRVATLEGRAASDLRAEHEACLAKISDAERRHQENRQKAENRQEEALSELKRLHRDEIEEVRRRSADSRTLDTLAGQVQASAGAVKLLQAEILERKKTSEVSREGQMEARERLVKELEHSARRAQQTAEDEVQRLQGTLMAMDQVMRALRGQNSGERERLRQEHLRMDALQASMSAEVEAVRGSVEVERQRLSEQFAVLEREKRENQAASRAESRRLAEQRVKLETERENLSVVQVAAAEAAEETARKQAMEGERLRVARQSLARESSSLEARLVAARAELLKADDVRASLTRLREQDELKRRRLGVVAAELEQALKEVQTRIDDCEESHREADTARAAALEESDRFSQERESLRRRSAQVEEAARRQDAERTSIAQARAQSATELSASRRLKSELARAFAVEQRHPKALDGVKFTLNTPRVFRIDGGVGVENGMQLSGFGCTRNKEVLLKVPPEVAFSSGVGDCSSSGNLPAWSTKGAGTGYGDHGNHASPHSPDAAMPHTGIPHTGIAAAEATLRAMSTGPILPGVDLGRELERLARRAAELRACTREQSAFLASSRVTGLSVTAPTVAGTLGLDEDTTFDIADRITNNVVPEEFSTGAEDLGVGMGIRARLCCGPSNTPIYSVNSLMSDEIQEMRVACHSDRSR